MQNVEQLQVAGLDVVIDEGGTDDQKVAARLLGLKSVKGLDIIEQAKSIPSHYRLFHFTENFTDKAREGYRGIVIDIQNEQVITNTFPHTSHVVCADLVPEDGNLSFKDVDGVDHRFNMDKVVISRLYNGIIMYVYRNAGQTFFGTHRKMTTEKARCGINRKTLKVMYDEAGGLSEDKLFDLTKEHSSTVYAFMVMHPDIYGPSRQQVINPYIVFLRQFTVTLDKYEQSTYAPGIWQGTTQQCDKVCMDVSGIYMPKHFTLTEAQHFLQYGYYSQCEVADERMGTGEAIILYQMNEEGKVADILEIHSPSYQWRKSLMSPNFNMRSHFYALMDVINKLPVVQDKVVVESMFHKLIPFECVNPKELKAIFEQQGYLYVGPLQTDNTAYQTYTNRIILLWMNYLVAHAANLQKEIIKYYDEYRVNRVKVCKWLVTLAKSDDPKVKEELGQMNPRVSGIIAGALKYSNHKGKNLYSVILNYVDEENGVSHYRLLRECEVSLLPEEEKNALRGLRLRNIRGF